MKKTIVQCDFDGTITEADVSFLILDAFADGDWRSALEEYKTGHITVGDFNTRAFGMVKADRQTLLNYVFQPGSFRVRAGLPELLAYCSGNGMEFVIVSNGLDFYIQAILERLGIVGVRVFAARSRFTHEGMKVQYVGPDRKPLDDNFKTAHTQYFIDHGYRVVYIGNGFSDIYPARIATHVFATADLVQRCRDTNLGCIPFNDFCDVVEGLKRLPLS